jgi:Arc/MetJ-type ribon-helix-helix transcriptional regulator
MGIKENLQNASNFIKDLLRHSPESREEKRQKLLEEIYGSKEAADLHGHFSDTDLARMGGEAHVLKTLETRLTNQETNLEKAENTTIFQNSPEESKDQ